MGWQEEITAAMASIPLEVERVRAEVAAGLAQTHNAIRLQGARVVGVGAGGRALACAGPGRLVGWSVRAGAGGAAVTLHDSRDTAGEVVAVIDVPAGTSQSIWLAPGGVSFTEGLHVEVTGALSGAVWLGAVD